MLLLELVCMCKACMMWLWILLYPYNRGWNDIFQTSVALQGKWLYYELMETVNYLEELLKTKEKPV